MPLAHSPNDNRAVPDPTQPTGTCILCVEHLLEGDNMVTSECGHIFHRNCIERHLIESSECPTCRSTSGLQKLVDNIPKAQETLAVSDVRIHNTRYREQRRPVSNPAQATMNETLGSSVHNSSNVEAQPNASTYCTTRGRRGRGGGVRKQTRISNPPVMPVVEIDYNKIFERMENIIDSKLSDMHSQPVVESVRTPSRTVPSRSSMRASISRSEAQSHSFLSPEKVT